MVWRAAFNNKKIGGLGADIKYDQKDDKSYGLDINALFILPKAGLMSQFKTLLLFLSRKSSNLFCALRD